MTQRKQAEGPRFAQPGLSIEIERINGSIRDPGVVIMADHDSLWWTGSAAGVDEGSTVSWLLNIHAPFQRVFLFSWLVAT